MEEENLSKRLLENGISFALRTAGKLGRRILKRILFKFFAWLFTVLAPVWVPVVIGLSVAFFVYFAMFMVPKYISSQMVLLPAELKPIFEEAQKEYGVDAPVLCALAYTESNFNPGARNASGAMGLMQFMPSTWATYGNGGDPYNARDSIMAAARYLKAIGWGKLDPVAVLAQYKGDPKSSEAQRLAQHTWDIAQKYKASWNDITNSPGSGSNYVIFNYGKNDIWSMERDQKLYKRYTDLQNSFLDEFMDQEELANAEIKEKSGNAATKKTVLEVWGQFMGDMPSQGAIIVAEQDQVKPHIVPWSLLAAVDRVVCDPIIHGRHGVEEKDNSSWWQKLLGNTPMTGRDPDPDKHFDILKPDIKMQKFRLYYYHTWTETDSEGNSQSYSEEYKYNINLLTSAKAYNADYGYQWKEKVIEYSTETSYTKIIVPEFIGVTKSGEPYEKLKALLDRYGLNSKMNLELVLQLAANMDESFNLDEITSNDFSDMYLEDIVYNGPLGEAHVPASGTVTSPYGWRIHPVIKVKSFHTGIDIGAAEGHPVVAYQSGVVVFAGVNGGYGKCIIIDHGTFRTLYGHLSSYNVQQGDKVTGGQEIGKVGRTGVATGPHLHFEIRIKEGNNIKPVDPAPYLKLR